MKTTILVIITLYIFTVGSFLEFYNLYFNKKTLFSALFYLKQFIQFLILICSVTLVFIIIYIQYLMK